MSVRTVDRRRAKGLALGEVKLGGTVRFDREKVEKALADENGR